MKTELVPFPWMLVSFHSILAFIVTELKTSSLHLCTQHDLKPLILHEYTVCHSRGLMFEMTDIDEAHHFLH